MKIDLYIDGIQADLDSSSLVQLNYTREELSNPAIVKNSYSQSVSLPRTANNRKIFCQYERMDSTGMNPLQRIPFVIMNDRAERLVTGYCKLESVSDTYSVALYGGLGDFFYALSYDDEGNALTLADMPFFDTPTTGYNFSDYGGFNALAVWDAWTCLSHGTMEHPSNRALFSVLNFAPCNNGLPDDFSTDKVLALAQEFEGMPSGGYARDGVIYRYRDGYTLMNVGANLTEWMTRDLRCNLQRPVFSISQFFNAIYNMGTIGDGYSFDVHESVTEQFNFYSYGWITLPMLDKEADLENLTLADFLKKTKSPADYLIGIAKTFGLVFLQEGKVIKLVSRDYYYSEGENINLEQKIDRNKEISIRPVDLESKYYRWGFSTEGDAASIYEETYGRPYGSLILNTGYDFARDTYDVLSSVPFSLTANVRETSYAFGTGIRYSAPGVYKTYWPWQGSKMTLYNVSGDDVATDEFPISGKRCLGLNSEDETNDLVDFLPRPQFHDADGKPTDGSNVILMFKGMKNVPHWIDEDTARDFGEKYWYHLSDPDVELFQKFNDGNPCWRTAQHTNANLNKITSLPWFECVGFGQPLEEYAYGYGCGFDPIYESFWQDYIADRYDKDCKVVTAWVDLRGMQVNESLLRNFYWFDNCVWVLNKIINHSLTTDGTTQCEFVKVKDVTSYTNSQYQ